MAPEARQHRFHVALRPFRTTVAEARHLHAIEREGESGETPFIAVIGLVLFLLLPAFVVLMGVAFAVYYLA